VQAGVNAAVGPVFAGATVTGCVTVPVRPLSSVTVSLTS
jgi:hypothetical protein